MRLFAARHGESQWDVENKICGRTGLPQTITAFLEGKLFQMG